MWQRGGRAALMLILFLSVKTDTPKALWASRENARWAIWRNILIALIFAHGPADVGRARGCSESRSGGPPSRLILLENGRLFGMVRIRADEDHLILHAVYKTVGSTFAQECSLEVAGIVLVVDGVRVVDGGN